MAVMAIPRVAWKIVERDGKPVVKMCCPACGIWADLDEHEIAADGTVTPSVVCANAGNLSQVVVESDQSLKVERIGDRALPCTFHENVRLEGW